MQLSKRTVSLLKNLSSINQNILIRAGKELTTITREKHIVARMDVEETFPVEFGIYELNSFLASLSLFNEPELTFEDKFVQISEKGQKRGGIKYYYSSPAVLVYNQRPIQFPPSPDFTFELTEEQLGKAQKAAAVLGVSDLVIAGDEEGISLIVYDKKRKVANDFEIQISDKPHEEFKVNLRQDNLKMIAGDYSVAVYKMGMVAFTSKDGTVQYGVAMERE